MQTKILKIIYLLLTLVFLNSCAAVNVGSSSLKEKGIKEAMSDGMIDATINKEYLNHNVNMFMNVDIEVVEGRVLLTGSVKKNQHRMDAIKLAWKVLGVREVINEIDVTDKGGIKRYLIDVKIKTQIRYKILADKNISSINYNFEAVNGTVYIIGIAQNKKELKTRKKDKKFTGKQEFNKWSLCLILDIPTLPKAGSRERFKKGIIVNNKFIFKRALLISVDQFVLRFNKMVYDYISTLIPNNRELGSQHLFYKPIIEYENWFQKTGHFVQDTPSLLDEIKESEKSENPLVTTSGENQELANAQKIILMQREKIKQLNFYSYK